MNITVAWRSNKAAVDGYRNCINAYLLLMSIVGVLLHVLWSPHFKDRVLAHDWSMPLGTFAILAAAVLVGRYGHDDGLLAVHAAPLHGQQRVQHLTRLLLRRIHHFHLLVRHALQPIAHVKSHVPTYVYVQRRHLKPALADTNSQNQIHITRKPRRTFQIHVNKHNKNRAIINLNRIF